MAPAAFVQPNHHAASFSELSMPDGARGKINLADVPALYPRLHSAHGGWRMGEIDLTEDRRQWRENLTDRQQAVLAYPIAHFVMGETNAGSELKHLMTYLERHDRARDAANVRLMFADEKKHGAACAQWLRDVADISDEKQAAIINPPFRRVFEKMLPERFEKLEVADATPRQVAAALVDYHAFSELSTAGAGLVGISRAIDRESDRQHTTLFPGLRQMFGRLRIDELRHLLLGLSHLHRLRSEGVPVIREGVWQSPFLAVAAASIGLVFTQRIPFPFKLTPFELIGTTVGALRRFTQQLRRGEVASLDDVLPKSF